MALAPAGMISSGVDVHSSTRSMPSPCTPAPAIACCAASMPRPVVVPPTRRSRIPVRSTIQASLVSRLSSRSTLVTILSGRALPQPVMRALEGATALILLHPGAQRVRGRQKSPRDHAVRSHAMGWLRVSRSPATARRPFTVPWNGERTSLPATCPTTRPRSMC